MMASVIERKPKDRDFLKSRDGMFFCVTGYLHPPDRITSYLKYSPDPTGKWQDGTTRYRRELAYYHVRNVAETLRYLEESFPAYVSYCSVRDIRFSLVPHTLVEKHYLPEVRLAQILETPGDPLEMQVCELVGQLQAVAGIPTRSLGVTGSILTNSHNPAFSDIDLLVVGRENVSRLRRLLKVDRDLLLRRPDVERTRRWCERVAARFPIDVPTAAYLAARRWNYGFFGERYVSIHAIRSDDEIGETYGERIYRHCGEARLRAVLTDTSDGLFMPAVYRVERVEVLDGSQAACSVDEIVSYEGLYCDIGEPGDVIEALGKVETVNGVVKRLLIGSTQLAGAGYIRPAG